MPTGTLISVEQYLATSYRPDCDYVDGRIEERNLGELDHSSLQTAVAAYFFSRRKQWDITVVVEQRVQVSKMRFRIPDVCVVLGKATEQIFRTPPFLCVEILSPEDRMKRVKERIDDYLRMGVSYVWVLDPNRTNKSTLRLQAVSPPSRIQGRCSAYRKPIIRTPPRRSLRLAQ